MANNFQFRKEYQESPIKNKIIPTRLKMPTEEDIEKALNKVREIKIYRNQKNSYGVIHVPWYLGKLKVKLVVVE